MSRLIVMIICFFFSMSSWAENEPLMHCGTFVISVSNNGNVYINNQRPDTQGGAFLGNKGDGTNVKYHWMLPDVNEGRWLNIDYIEREGKAMLNVERVRTNMSQPREYWSYDCHKR